jgi:hypothetical protein
MHQGGVDTVLTNDDKDKRDPRIDGLRVVFDRFDEDSCMAGNCNGNLILYEGGQEIELDTRRGRDPDRDYQISGDWVVFTRMELDGTTQVWRRSVAGDEQQVTVFGSSSYVDVLAGTGDLTFITDGGSADRRHLFVNSSGSTTEVGSGLGIAKNVNGEWIVLLGNRVFRVE